MDDISLHVRRTHLRLKEVLKLYGVSKSTYHGWQSADVAEPQAKRSNIRSPLPEEVEAVIAYRRLHADVGYRKLTHMMNDARVAFLSESAVFSILQTHGLLSRWDKTGREPADKEYRHKPKVVHEHWHTDLAYVKIRGVFYYLIMVLDGYSRYLLGWELLSDMNGSSVEDFIQRVRERYPEARPKLIHDNGSQFVSRDFKQLMSRLSLDSVCTRRNHPETNGKAERFVGTVRCEALRPSSPTSYQEACCELERFAYLYNHQRLHAGINFVRPADRFFGRDEQVRSERFERRRVASAARRQLNKERGTSKVQ